LAIAQMDEAVQQNAALVEQAAAASDAMQNQAAALARVVSVFKLENTPEAPEGKAEPQAASAPVEIAAKLAEHAQVVALHRPGPLPRLAAANEWHEF
ncbi:MAG: hypothetical protein ACM3WS_02270, partial [Bacillota bacterium]